MQVSSIELAVQVALK